MPGTSEKKGTSTARDGLETGTAQAVLAMYNVALLDHSVPITFKGAASDEFTVNPSPKTAGQTWAKYEVSDKQQHRTITTDGTTLTDKGAKTFVSNIINKFGAESAAENVQQAVFSLEEQGVSSITRQNMNNAIKRGYTLLLREEAASTEQAQR